MVMPPAPHQFMLVMYGGPRDGEEIAGIQVPPELHLPFRADVSQPGQTLAYRHGTCTRQCQGHKHAYAYSGILA